MRERSRAPRAARPVKMSAIRPQGQRYDKTRIALAVVHQLGDVKLLDSVEYLRRRCFPAESCLLKYDAVDLLDFVKVIAQSQGHEKGPELPIDNESSNKDQYEDQRNGNDADEDICNDQAAAQTPRKCDRMTPNNRMR